MFEAGIWADRKQRRKRVHQPRHRRECVGELVQIDGCELWAAVLEPPVLIRDEQLRRGPKRRSGPQRRDQSEASSVQDRLN
jgi:hypothetical protein